MLNVNQFQLVSGRPSVHWVQEYFDLKYWENFFGLILTDLVNSGHLLLLSRSVDIRKYV